MFLNAAYSCIFSRHDCDRTYSHTRSQHQITVGFILQWYVNNHLQFTFHQFQLRRDNTVSEPCRGLQIQTVIKTFTVVGFYSDCSGTTVQVLVESDVFRVNVYICHGYAFSISLTVRLEHSSLCHVDREGTFDLRCSTMHWYHTLLTLRIYPRAGITSIAVGECGT